jgi:hypothetical protein
MEFRSDNSGFQLVLPDNFESLDEFFKKHINPPANQ